MLEEVYQRRLGHTTNFVTGEKELREAMRIMMAK